MDLSGNGNNGTIYSAAWSGDHPVLPVFGCTDTYAENYNPDATADDGSCSGYPDNGNYSLHFNGSGDHVNLGTSPSTEINGDITLATWVRIDDFDNQNAGVVSKVSDGSPVAYGIEKTSTQNSLSFWTGDGNNFCEVVSPILATDTWYFVAATNDGSTSRIYINGELTNTSNCGSPAGPTADLRIGVHSNLSNNERFWDGLIDDVSIWSAVLSDNDIYDLYYNPATGNEEDLAAHWSFNSGEGSLLYDRTGNANHGEINGGTWTEQIPVLPIEGFTSVGSFNGNMYYISNAGGNYYDGLDLCEDKGGHLVTITSEEENNFVLNKLMGYSGGANHLWLGLNDLDEDGNFEWITGEPLSYTNWSDGPVTGLAVEMESGSGAWRPTGADDNQDYRRYMLEIESQPIELGCTDSYAENFNPDATVDDGSCSGYPDNGYYSLSFDGEDDHVVVNNFEGSFSTFSFTTRAFINSESLPWRTLFYLVLRLAVITHTQDPLIWGLMLTMVSGLT